jgi:hypothetical protein
MRGGSDRPKGGVCFALGILKKFTISGSGSVVSRKFQQWFSDLKKILKKLGMYYSVSSKCEFRILTQA